MPTDTQKHSELLKDTETHSARTISHRHTLRHTTLAHSDTPTQAGSETHKHTVTRPLTHRRTLTHTHLRSPIRASHLARGQLGFQEPLPWTRTGQSRSPHTPRPRADPSRGATDRPTLLWFLCFNRSADTTLGSPLVAGRSCGGSGTAEREAPPGVSARRAPRGRRGGQGGGLPRGPVGPRCRSGSRLAGKAKVTSRSGVALPPCGRGRSAPPPRPLGRSRERRPGAPGHLEAGGGRRAPGVPSPGLQQPRLNPGRDGGGGCRDPRPVSPPQVGPRAAATRRRPQPQRRWAAPWTPRPGPGAKEGFPAAP